MANAILSRGNSPIRGGGKIGDIKYTQRTLTPDWKRCDGTLIDYIDISPEYAALADGDVFTSGECKTYLNNYSRMSQQMKDLYDSKEHSNDNYIFFWDNGNNQGCGFLYEEWSAVHFSRYIHIVFEKIDKTIVDMNTLIDAGNFMTVEDWKGSLYYGSESPIYTSLVHICTYRTCNNNFAILLHTYKDYINQNGEVCIDNVYFCGLNLETGVSNFRVSSTLADGGGYGSDINNHRFAISKNCDSALYISIWDVIEHNDHKPGVISIRFTNNMAYISDFLYDSWFNLPQYSDTSLVVTENDCYGIVRSYKNDDILDSQVYLFYSNRDPIEFEDDFVDIVFTNGYALLHNNIPYVSYTATDSALSTNEYLINMIDNSTIVLSSRMAINTYKYYLESDYYEKKYLINNIGRAVEISDSISLEEIVNKAMSGGDISLNRKLVKEYQFGNEKFLYFPKDKSLFGPSLPDDDSGYAYVKTE